MTHEDARELVLAKLADIAPDADLDELEGDAELREELDLDSMDALTLLEELAATIDHDIPDRDAARLHTLDDLTDYVVAQATQGGHHVR